MGVDAPDAPVGFDRTDLVTAMRARIARREVHVTTCKPDAKATWRLTLEPINPVSLRLLLTGPDVEAERVVTTDGMSPEEIVQYISLTAVEAVRSSMDAVLRRMGLSVKPPVDPIADLEKRAPPKACPEVKPCPEPEVRIENVPIPARAGVSLTGGPVWAVEGSRFSGYVELAGGLRIGHFAVLVHGGLNVVPGVGEGDAEVQVWEPELGVTVYWRTAFLAVGLRAQNRISIVRATGDNVEDELQLFANGGFGILADFAVWQSDDWEIGVVARAWYWPQALRLTVEDTVIYTQSHTEVTVGPIVSFFPE